MDKSAAFAASAGARANATGLDSFLSAFPKEHLTDTHEEKMYGFAWGFLPNASLESYLLQNWFTGRPAYDAVFINSLSNSTQVGLICMRLSLGVPLAVVLLCSCVSCYFSLTFSFRVVSSLFSICLGMFHGCCVCLDCSVHHKSSTRSGPKKADHML